MLHIAVLLLSAEWRYCCERKKTLAIREDAMKSYVFQVIVEPDKQPDGTPAFHGYCPALPGCHTWGYTAEDALAKIQEAVSLYVEDLVDSGKPIPVNSPHGGVSEFSTPSVVVNL
jgi:predicted RNase H-like HicB family nuclease